MGPDVGALRDARAAASFLTRVPLGAHGGDASEIGRGVVWFPVVGAAIGACVGLVYVAAMQILPSFVSAVLAVAAGVLLTGAFHEDGLADTADALGGSFDRDGALRIFHDPRHGSYGVLALVLSVVLRITALAGLPALTGLIVMTVAHAVSRAAALGVLGLVPAATDEGLGATYARHAPRSRVITAVAVGVVATLPFGVWIPFVIGAAVAASALVSRMSIRRIGGITGDVLGAVQQIVEIVTLLVAVAVVHNGARGSLL